MDGQRFDSLVRALAAATSRRSLVKAALGSAGGAAFSALGLDRFLSAQQSCPPGQIPCDGGCVDPAADPRNCGGCGARCGPGEHCCEGLCHAACPSGSAFDPTSCQCRCADDRLPCGGRRCCAEDEACVDGACCTSRGGACAGDRDCCAGLRCCDGQCVDTRTHPGHCGGCGNACEADPYLCEAPLCRNGTCDRRQVPDGTRCVAGDDSFHCCAGICADLYDEQTCGACNIVCDPGEVCCRGEGCFDLEIDPSHCGGCFHQCNPGDDCVAGSCCPGAGRPCQSDGDCCPGYTCEMGACRAPERPGGEAGEPAAGPGAVGNPCGPGAPCAPGLACCAGMCVDFAMDAQHCGGCGRRCPPGTSCVGRTCQATPSGPGAPGPAPGMPTTEPGAFAPSTPTAAPGTPEPGMLPVERGTPTIEPRTSPPGTPVAEGCGEGPPCAAGEICCQGRCYGPCPPGTMFDTSACACRCPDGRAPCGQICPDYRTDPRACGSCGTTCNVAAGYVCAEGVCCKPPGVTCSGMAECCAGYVCDPGRNVCVPETGPVVVTDLCPDGQPRCGGRCCPANVSCCDGTCRDLQTDLDHCGGCGVACDVAEGYGCVSGRCCKQEGSPCAATSECCAGYACVDGLCQTPAEVCADGRPPCDGQCCQPGFTCCDGACVDPRSDWRHCGACGRACPDGSSCCDGACVDTQTDPSACGGCERRCADGELCERGICYDPCAVAPRSCQTTSDCGPSGAWHCARSGGSGVCYARCQEAGECCPGEICAVAPFGDSIGSVCVVPCQTSAGCPAGWECYRAPDAPSGVCVPPCARGGQCVETRDCCPGEVCAAGICRLAPGQPGSPCDPATPCAEGIVCCVDTCVDTRSDPRACGACDTPCPADSACCDGRCADLQTDPDACGACDRRCEVYQACEAGTCCSLEGGPCDGDGTCCAGLSCDPATSSCVIATAICADGRPPCAGLCCDADAICDAATGTCQPAGQPVERLCGGVACPAGWACCDDRCVDTESDPDSCGDCATRCSAWYDPYDCLRPICVAGQCDYGPAEDGTACAGDGYACCDGRCTYVVADPAHCGQCGVQCRDDQVCIGYCCAIDGGSCSTSEECCAGYVCDSARGVCVTAADRACSDDRDCPSGHACCYGRCTSLADDPWNCGNCGYRCPEDDCQAAVCRSGVCSVVDRPNDTPCANGGCTRGVCRNGRCDGQQAPDGAPCDLGNPCVINGVCRSGACEPVRVPDGTPCERNNPCLRDGVCRGAVCRGEYAPYGTACDGHGCLEPGGVCDWGICRGTPRPDGTACDDGDPCTENDVCWQGVCRGTTVQCLDYDPRCADALCDATVGGCHYLSKPDGVSCGPAGEVCSAGVCVAPQAQGCGGGPPCDPAVATCIGDGCCPYEGICGGICCDYGTPLGYSHFCHHDVCCRVHLICGDQCCGGGVDPIPGDQSTDLVCACGTCRPTLGPCDVNGACGCPEDGEWREVCLTDENGRSFCCPGHRACGAVCCGPHQHCEGGQCADGYPRRFRPR